MAVELRGQMIRAVVVLSLLALAAPALAETRAPIGPANTGSVSSRALGTPSPPSTSSSSSTPSPSASSSPRTASPNPQPPPPTGTTQPSEACRKFPNLC
jgi:hypothetical protein